MIKFVSASFTAIIISCVACFGKLPSQQSLSFGLNISGDATPAVLAKMLEVNKNQVAEIKFDKGTYHFYPEKALERYLNMSNHGDGLVRTAFPIFNMKNLLIDGQGSTFIFHGIMVPFLVDNSQNITIRNVEIDWATPFHSEGLVVANDPIKKTFDLQISDEYPYEIKNDQLVFVKEYYHHTLGQSILFDPKTKGVAFETEKYTPITTIGKTTIQNQIKSIKYKYEVDPRSPEIRNIGTEDRLVAEQLRPGLVRIHNHGKKMPPVGLILVCKGEQGENRVAPAFRISYTKGFKAENINVHHAGGMGFLAENSANIILDSFNVTPSHGRMVSTTADATHFVGCRGNITIQNCTFNNQLDDGVNIHGTYQQVMDVLDDHRLGVYMGHFQQKGFKIGSPGDTLGFVRLKNSFFAFEKRTIKSIEEINGRYQILTFNETLPKDIMVGDLLENLEAYPEVLIQNCNISRNRARGLLISTPKKTVIKNNFFGTEMEAILLPVESGFWYESGSASHLTITNNVFQDCNIASFDRGVIRFVTDDDSRHIAFRDIEISNNQFRQFDNLILEIGNVDNLFFKGNTIINSGTYPQVFPKNPAIKVKASKNIVFKNNKYEGKAKVILETDKSMPAIQFN